MDIKATDLRIGNWVYAATGENDEPIPCLVSGIRKTHIYWGSSPWDGNDTRIEFVKGIPLSSDILEKWGKKYSSNDQNWEYEISVGALKWYFRWNTEWYSEIGNIYLGAGVQYLHQVQNLYFYIAGRDLTVNL